MDERDEQLWTDVDRYIGEHLGVSDPALETALSGSVDAGLPEIAVSPPQGKLLMLLAASVGARRILEIGTLGGYSTIWLARALPADGELITCEYSSEHAHRRPTERRPCGDRRSCRYQGRRRARHAADADRPVRPDVRRRRQGAQRRLLPVGGDTQPTRFTGRHRQHGSRRCHRRRLAQGTGDRRHSRPVRRGARRATSVGDGDPDRRKQGLRRIRARARARRLRPVPRGRLGSELDCLQCVGAGQPLGPLAEPPLTVVVAGHLPGQGVPR